ncbi:M56 family metallopeptidase [Brevibacterium album]|uniref:M56 family metallopeptidase n=1 Tax=Brevibacterium album TaxID=417948 RepID=UPI00041EF4C9|nr:M56 family metallopeptidase [Brevibacterium album]
MTAVGIAMAVLAVLLAWPVPTALARRQAGRADVDPVSGILLWQAVGLAGGLSLISACLAFALAPLVGAGAAGPAVLDWWRWPALAVGAVLLLALLLALAWETRAAARARVRHRDMLALVSQSSPHVPGMRIIDTDHAVAYCLAGRGGTTVVSTGLLQLLDANERDAVIAHEREHLRVRHDLLALPFASWNRMLPFLPVTRTALAAVSGLIEIMADDAARTVTSPAALRTALAKTAERTELAAGTHASRHDPRLTEVRRRRLLMDPRQLPDTRRMRVKAAVLACCLLLVPPAVLVGTVVYS